MTGWGRGGRRLNRRAALCLVVSLSIASSAATCRGDGPSEAVPAEVEIDWPDAGALPPARAGFRDAGV